MPEGVVIRNTGDIYKAHEQNDVIVGLCVDQILPAVNYAFQQKTQVVLHVRFVRHISIFVVSIGFLSFFFKNCHNSIKFC